MRHLVTALKYAALTLGAVLLLNSVAIVISRAVHHFRN